MDLLRQANTNIPQQINFTGKLEDDGATSCEKLFHFFFRLINGHRIM